MNVEDIINLLAEEHNKLIKACCLTEELYEKLQNPSVELQAKLIANLKNPLFAKYWAQLEFLEYLKQEITKNYLPF